MVDEVVDVGAHDGAARRGEDDPIAVLEGPEQSVVRVLRPRQSLPRGTDVGIELPQQRLGCFEAVLRSGREVECGLAHGVRNPAGDPSHELSEVTQSKGLWMGLPRTLHGRHALE